MQQNGATRPGFAPTSEAEVREVIAEAFGSHRTLDVVGGGTKRRMRDLTPAATLAMTGVCGITDYDPDELVLTARAGTPLAEIEEALAARRQMLAFEPFDHAVLAGQVAGRATLGGIVAANVSGPRRLSAGAARDHVLGFRAVSGTGEMLKGGGAVVKNVTGFDLPKLMTGSWGTLAVLTSVTVRVLPRPRTEKTLLFTGLGDSEAGALMRAAMASPAAVSCAAHRPARGSGAASGSSAAPESGVVTGRGAAAGRGAAPSGFMTTRPGTALTALRVEGFGRSVDARCRALADVLARFGPGSLLDVEDSESGWRAVRDVAVLPRAGHLLWRISVPPVAGAQLRGLLGDAAQVLYDWGGALVWAAVPEGAAEGPRVPAMARALGGHASLVRAPPGWRRDAAVADGAMGPGAATDDSLQRLRARVKAAFDPRGILNPGLDPAAEC